MIDLPVPKTKLWVSKYKYHPTFSQPNSTLHRAWLQKALKNVGLINDWIGGFWGFCSAFRIQGLTTLRVFGSSELPVSMSSSSWTHRHAPSYTIFCSFLPETSLWNKISLGLLYFSMVSFIQCGIFTMQGLWWNSVKGTAQILGEEVVWLFGSPAFLFCFCCLGREFWDRILLFCRMPSNKVCLSLSPACWDVSSAATPGNRYILDLGFWAVVFFSFILSLLSWASESLSCWVF